MFKRILLYVFLLALFGGATYGLLKAGSHLFVSGPTEAQVPHPPAQSAATPHASPLAIMLLQVVVVVAVARGMGALFARLGQPTVIGEMAAGILLGPSLLGALAPAVSSAVFPPNSLGSLQMVSQIGVILFLFVVGIDLDIRHLRQTAHSVILISHVSIVAPFFLGVGLAIFLFRDLAMPSVTFIVFALFMGIAMSITAFPVLARIIEERGLSKTELGRTALACAAVDDATAWCILAIVVAIAQSADLATAALTFAWSGGFIVLMFFVVQPLLTRVFGEAEPSPTRAKTILAAAVVIAFLSAYIAETIGIHALFGAFLAGVIMPVNPALRAMLRDRLETFSSAFLLPLFFAFTGLRTQVSLIGDWQSLLICALIILVAVTGKLGGGMFAARFTGMSWRDSFSIGSLMNTRGLMELVVLNIGYDLGILSPRIFAMMVIMAFVTTMMTGPLLSFAQRTSKVYAPARI